MKRKLLIPLFMSVLVLPRPADAQVVGPADLRGWDSVTVAIPESLLAPLDSIQPRFSWKERVLQGAIAGAVTGAVIPRVLPECAPTGSAIGSSFVGAVVGGIRGLFAGDPPRTTTQTETDTDHRPRGPFPFDQERCDGGRSEIGPNHP